MSTQGFTPYSKVELTDFSEVRITYQVATAKLDSSRKIMWVAFAGDYGHGAGGNGDARYMEAMCSAAVQLIGPDGIIFDFTDLNYEWGDQLSKVYNVAFDWFIHKTAPFALVLGPGCQMAVRSLLADDGWEQEELGWVFETMCDAQKYVETVMAELRRTADQEYEANKLLQDRQFWDLLGPDVGPENCREGECSRLRAKDTVFCRVHHWEKVQHRTCPFSTETTNPLRNGE